ncbi:MAG TPA: helix-turn-helix domain-containing protein [Microlunatus sp.]
MDLFRDVDHEVVRDRLWSVEEVSYYLGVPVGTLYSWRVQRKGPPCRRLGRVLRYRPADVEEWFSALGDWSETG